MGAARDLQLVRRVRECSGVKLLPDTLMELRTDLRKSCEDIDDDHHLLNAWLSRVAPSVQVKPAEGVPPGYV